MAVQNLRPTDAPAVKDLRSTIETIDALSQEGFSQIAAIASLGVLALKAGHTTATDTLIGALEAIIGKARDIENCINVEAEAVCCNYAKPLASAEVHRRGVAD